MRRKLSIDCAHCGARKHGVFCTLSDLELGELNLQKNCNTYKKGQTLFLEGTPPFGLYCLNSGKIKITKTGVSGKETILRIASPGDLLGYEGLFSDTSHQASAVALDDAQVCFISKTTIMSLVRKNPELSLEIIKRISQHMGAAEEKVTSLAQKSVREKFAELLLLLKESHGKEHQKGVLLDIRLTREEMASMIGAASENLIRLVTEFKNDGLLEQQGKQLFLTDIKKIENIANI